jgi:hypothetical protein
MRYFTFRIIQLYIFDLLFCLGVYVLLHIFVNLNYFGTTANKQNLSFFYAKQIFEGFNLEIHGI